MKQIKTPVKKTATKKVPQRDGLAKAVKDMAKRFI